MSVETEGQFQHLPLRALVVENDLVDRELLARVLRQKGFEAQTAIGAAQAAAVLLNADFRYDLLLVDLNLEPVDGVELLRHLGSLPVDRRPGKIVAISHSLAPYYPRLSELQLELELFQKPLHLPSLMKVISEVKSNGSAPASGNVMSDDANQHDHGHDA